MGFFEGDFKDDRPDFRPNQEDLELHRYWTSHDRAANLRLFRLVSEVLRAIEAGVFHPVVGWHCQDCPYRSRCWAWG